MLLPLCLSAATNDLTGALQRGLFEEEANRNLDAAAQAYQAVSAQFDQDRKLAATAIFRLGEVYRKQGRTNEAAAQYERIVREFSDQPTLVTLSRQNLAGLGTRTEAPASPPLTRAARLEQKRFLEEELKLVEQDVTELKKQSESGIVTQAEVRAKEREVLKIKQQLAALSVDTDEAAIGKATADIPVLLDDEEKEIRRIQAMIQNSPDLINSKSGLMTPLCQAAAKGQVRVAEFLLANGASVDQKSDVKGFPNSGDIRAGGAPIHHAATGGHKAMVELLTRYKANLELGNQYGQTALHIAASMGFKAVAEALVAAKANANARDYSQQTPLHSAVGHPAMAGFLLAHGATVDAENGAGQTPLMLAAMWGDLEVLQQLLAAGANPNHEDKQGRTVLSWAAVGSENKRGQLECVKALLAAKADPNAGKENLPLPAALSQGSLGNTEVLELLLKNGANPNQSSKISWQFSTPAGNFSAGTYTPLRLAVLRAHPPFVKLLLQYKADAREKNADGLPLIVEAYAKVRGDDCNEILKAFLDAGADPNANDGERRYLLTMAAGGNSKAVALLLAHGADVNVRGQNYMTPLHWAIQSGRKEAVELLLDHKADANALDVTGSTPLHRAVDYRHKEIVELLLTHGADPNIRNSDGQTPLDFAIRQTPPPGVSVAPFIPGVPGRVGVPGGVFPGGVRPPTVAPGSPASAEPTDVVALLRQHGALDDLPDFNRIEVRRPATAYSVPVFWKGTNDWNRFTLLDVLASLPNELTFPDLHRIAVVRASAKAGQPARRITVDLLLPTGVVDCAKDLPLEFGDVVEIPEREHTLQEPPVRLTSEEFEQIAKCREGTAALLVRGKRTELQVRPSKQSIMIGHVLMRHEVRSALFSSSDLSRVKVTRRDPASGKQHEWIVDCSGESPYFWLRDGDLIEVPDKP